ncbi:MULTISPECIES: DUF934 domain-containing protein [unclassified Polynucleobacter]|jgi:uncharacterized protein (DUF934 family)|uniref:DUF934 domain-containing protein n=1 Tax=unclassified Polynucleobacter TaxID=2640945 RepID=UPI000BCBA3D4|nr:MULTISPECIES: DUF934 domain-containing protein [unclassified Polynucleobacter]OYY13891.1 MAG: hypothetical protein B7Y67_11770 [Polynucleobacter sp. 35-46-11]OZA74973.1 MAG: hypothetical protein B7X71_12375 [Polynucleobacter sp. 39-46-10]
MNHQIIYYPKDGKPLLMINEWYVWNREHDEGGIPDLAHGFHKVLVPFHWWLSHHKNPDILDRAQDGKIGVWFAADDDILKYSEIIESGKLIWPVVGAYFPFFRDGRSFSTAALLRERFDWQGEIRALGDVLIDQLLQGARVGFDSFELRPDQNLDIALKQFNLYSVTTQNSWREQRATIA